MFPSYTFEHIHSTAWSPSRRSNDYRRLGRRPGRCQPLTVSVEEISGSLESFPIPTRHSSKRFSRASFYEMLIGHRLTAQSQVINWPPTSSVWVNEGRPNHEIWL